ncbi:MAG: hypothetical protein K9M75_07200 [Phycisphaerae bacterium]|nr:hypothetical protein [Phycisphaerae bacterium]
MLIKKSILFSAVILLFFISGCGTWRVVPAHGGGKRFDEEQRVVAGCIRTAIAQMDFSELKGQKVSFIISNLSQDGGGWIMNSGFTNLSGSISDFNTEYMANLRDNIRDGWDAGISYRARPEFRPTVFRSNEDMNYFNSFLTLKMRMSGLDFLARGGEKTLYVIVDILGTNLSTEDAVIAWSEKLRATCELTYYAVDNKTNKMLFKPRSVSGISEYINHNSYFYLHNGTEFRMVAVPPTGFPVDEKLTLTDFDNNGLRNFIENITSPKSKKQKDMESKLQLADSHIKARNFGAAEALINEVLTKDPGNPNVSAVRSRLDNELQVSIQEIQDALKELRQ